MQWAMRLICLVLYAGAGLCANAGDLAGLDTGAMKKLSLARAALPDAVFTTEEGREARLSDFRGQPMLVNFWATWCAPCRQEMPSLDALQAAFAKTPFKVMTIATGRSPAAAIDRFFAETGVSHLPRHRDPDMRLARAMGVLGLPVSVLIDAEGQEVGRLIGDADWSSPEAHALVTRLLP